MARHVFIFNAPSGREMCDFCSTSPTARLYGCRNFVVPRTNQTVFRHDSIGAWAACDRCASFIDAGLWSQLTDRALRQFMKKNGLPRYTEFEVREQLADIYQLFKEHMIRDS